MSSAAEASTGRRTPAFLTQGFRPFFLAAGVWSAAALALWIVMLVTGGGVAEPVRSAHLAYP